MNKDWLPFFSMFFWWCTKVAGLGLFLSGMIALGTMLINGFNFWHLILTVGFPFVIGYVLLATELVFDLATSEQRRRLTSK